MEETRPKRSPKMAKPRTRHQLIVECWEKLGKPGLGARELSAIQAELDGRFGQSAVNSPAAIARLLADEGAELRHPEVIECDAAWRAERIRAEEQQFSEKNLPATIEVLTMARAEKLIEELEERRIQSDATETQSIRSIAIEAREAAQRHTRRKTLDQLKRAEQQEIAEWLGVWIKTPSLFEDWLDLRRRSPEFRRKFGR
jgi:hypothetical protein